MVWVQIAPRIQTMVCNMGAKLLPWFVVVGAMRAARRPPEALAVVPASLHPLYCTQRMIVADGCCCTRSVRCTQPCVRESLSSMAAWCQRTGAVVRGRELHEEHRDATPVCMRRHTRASVIAAQHSEDLVTRRYPCPFFADGIGS
jgi:hypothetical protein